MSAPQAPGDGDTGAGGHDGQDLSGTDGEGHAADVFDFLQQAYRLRAGGAGGEYTAVHGEFGDNNSHRLLDDDDEEDEEDNDDYHGRCRTP